MSSAVLSVSFFRWLNCSDISGVLYRKYKSFAFYSFGRLKLKLFKYWKNQVQHTSYYRRVNSRILMRLNCLKLASGFDKWFGVVNDKLRQASFLLNSSSINAVQEDLKVGALKCEELKSLIDEMVPKPHLLAIEEKVRSLKLELDCRPTMEQIGILEQEIKVLNDSKALVELDNLRLKHLLTEMVPKERLEDALRFAGPQKAPGRERSAAIQHDQAAREESKRTAAELEDTKKTFALKQTKLEVELQNAHEEIKALTSSLALCKESVFSAASLTGSIVEMQSHLYILNTKYSKAFEQLIQMISQTVPKSALSKCQEKMRTVVEERDSLLLMLETMVPKVDLIKSQDMYKGAKKEVERLQRVCSNMVPQTDLDSAKDELTALNLECERMRKLINGMVPKSQIQAAQDDSSALKSEIERLQNIIAGMVPRFHLHKCLDDVAAAKSLMLSVKTDALRLKAKCSADVQMLQSDINGLLDQKDTQIMMLSSEVERLSSILTSDTNLGLARQQQSRALISPGRDLSKRLSFLMPASGLARGQEGRLAPFMIQVHDPEETDALLADGTESSESVKYTTLVTC